MKNKLPQDSYSYFQEIQHSIPLTGPVAHENFAQFEQDCGVFVKLVRAEIDSFNLHQRLNNADEYIGELEIMLYAWPKLSEDEHPEALPAEMCSLLHTLCSILRPQQHPDPVMPDLMINWYENWLKSEMAILSQLIENNGYNQEIQQLMDQVYRSCIARERPFNYPKWQQVFRLIHFNQSFFKKPETETDGTAFILHLIGLNLNHSAVLEYITSWISAHIAGHFTLIEKLSQLYYIKKVIAQTVTHTTTAFSDRRPNLMNQMIAFVNEEINYLKEFEAREAFPFDNLFNGHLKINLSVKQIGILIKAALGVGLISTDNTAALLDHIIKHVSSKHSDHIAKKSLGNSLYQGSDKDIDVIEEVLEAINVFINKLRGFGE